MERVINSLKFGLLFLYATSGLSAAAPQAPRLELGPAADSEQIKALLAIDKILTTNIATRSTVQASDSAPGIVTILEKSQLIPFGVRTVSDALTLVPGFDRPEPLISNDEPVLRGIGGIFSGSSGKILYLINGVPTNNTISANSSLVLQMPIDQISRIEIIRGPGAAIYGEYALLGVINVVTNDDTDFFYVRSGSFASTSVGGQLSIKHSDELQSNLSLSHWDTQGPQLDSGTDLLHALGRPEESNAPGQPNLDRSFDSLFYSLKAKKWSISAFHLADKRGDGYGALEALSLADHKVQTATQSAINFKAQSNINKFIINYTASAKSFDRKNRNMTLLPPGALGIYPSGIIANSNEREIRYEAGVSLLRSTKQHEQVYGVEVSNSKSDNIYFSGNTDESQNIPGTGLPLPLAEFKEQPLGLENKQRRIISAYFSDQYHITNQWELVTGVRIDDYSDINNSDLFSPRFAATYSNNNQHLYKLQFSRAFRPPSFSELHYEIGSGSQGNAGNPDLRSETIDAIELAHVYRNHGTRVRSVLFHSTISDLIQLSPDIKFENISDVKSSGLEIELEHSPAAGLNLTANISYTNARDAITNNKIVGSTDWLANAAVNYQPRGRYSLSARYHYVGARHRSPTDNRVSLSDYGLINISAYIKDVMMPGLSLRIGINDLFDADNRNPAPELTYVKDYPGAGRSIWAQLVKEFH